MEWCFTALFQPGRRASEWHHGRRSIRCPVQPASTSRQSRHRTKGEIACIWRWYVLQTFYAIPMPFICTSVAKVLSTMKLTSLRLQITRRHRHPRLHPRRRPRKRSSRSTQPSARDQARCSSMESWFGARLHSVRDDQCFQSGRWPPTTI
jgi:hypothetical protein